MVKVRFGLSRIMWNLHPVLLKRTSGLAGFFNRNIQLVGEFKFFREFGWRKNGATDWKQRKAANQWHQL